MVTNTEYTPEQALVSRQNQFKPDAIPTGTGLNTRPDMVRHKTEFAILAWLF